MTERCKITHPMLVGWAAAGLSATLLLSGCGGGGGGGSSSSPTPTPPAQTVAGPTVVQGNNASQVAVGNADPGTGQAATPEVDVLADAAPAAGVTVSIKTDPSAPSVPSGSGGFIVDSTIYDIEPAGTQFQNGGITIRIPYTNPTSSAVASTLIYYYDSTTGIWRPVTDASGTGSPDVSSSNNTVMSITTNRIQLGRNNGGAPTDYAVLSSVVPSAPAQP